MSDSEHPLIDDTEARRRLVSIPIANTGALTPEERIRIIDAVAAYRSARCYTLREVAQQVEGLRDNTLSEILSGTYERKVAPTTFDAHLRALNQWMEQDAQRRAGQSHDRPLTTTLVVKLVRTAVQMCRQQSTMGYVTGPAGVGKTATIREIMANERGALYVLACRDVRAPIRMVDAIANTLKVGRRNRASILRGVSIFQRIVGVLRGSHRLMVVDDAHKLKTDTIELIREIHDACGIPVLLIGEFRLAEKIARTTSEDSGQLESRFGVRIDVRRARSDPGRGKERALFTTKEIREIISAPGLRYSPGAIAYLHDLANTHGRGGIRAILFMIPMAARAARKAAKVDAKQPVTITEDALRFVANDSDTTRMVALDERYERARIAAKTA